MDFVEPGRWFYLGGVDVNTAASASPNITLSGHPANPQPNSSLTATATVNDSDDSANGGLAQIVEWDTNLDGTFDSTTRSSGWTTGLTSSTRSISTAGLTRGQTYTVRARVRDNGAISSADTSSRLVNATQTFTVAKATPTDRDPGDSERDDRRADLRPGRRSRAATHRPGRSPSGPDGPNDANCTGAVAFTDTENVSGNGTYTTNPAFTPAAAGTYRWTAAYSGDSGNDPATRRLQRGERDIGGRSGEPVDLDTGKSRGDGRLGDQRPGHDRGRLQPDGHHHLQGLRSGRRDLHRPGRLHRHRDGERQRHLRDQPGVHPRHGRHLRLIASYSGNANNDPVAGACNDPNESVDVAKDAPTISTQAQANAAVGSAITDSATIAGGFNPTGTITFDLFGPGDTTCATPIGTETETVSGNGTYTTTPGITASDLGTYRSIASYSGDTEQRSGCGSVQRPE